MTIKEALKKFTHSKKLKGLSKKSIIDYRDFANLFVKFIGEDIDILDISQEDIDEYIEYQIDRNISKSTISTYIRHLKIFLKWIAENYEVYYEYKKINVPKASKRRLKIYSDEDIKLIFDSCDNSIPWIEDRNKTIISFMLDSGLRQGEIVSLRHENIYVKNNRMLVRGKGDKERYVPLGNNSIALYKKYINSCPYESDYVFLAKDGERIKENTIKLFINKLAKTLPFELSSHKLRHNFATNYCLDMYHKYNNIDIYRLMSIMGHEDVKTTRVYLHIASEIISSTESLSHLDMIFEA